MKIPVNIFNENNQQQQVFLEKLPDQCPACKRSIQPRFAGGTFNSNRSDSIRIAQICPANECQEIFVGKYSSNVMPIGENPCRLVSSSLLVFKKQKEFSPDIGKISPSFVETFNQALTAKSNGLDQVAGPGFRKALEFLIKDFLINSKYNENETKKEEVKKLFLARCISDHIKEERIKACAQRAAWLGNDETHYTRRWGDKDIGDLKTLIEMTVAWIDLVVKSDKYLESMPE